MLVIDDRGQVTRSEVTYRSAREDQPALSCTQTRGDIDPDVSQGHGCLEVRRYWVAEDLRTLARNRRVGGHAQHRH